MVEELDCRREALGCQERQLNRGSACFAVQWEPHGSATAPGKLWGGGPLPSILPQWKAVLDLTHCPSALPGQTFPLGENKELGLVKQFTWIEHPLSGCLWGAPPVLAPPHTHCLLDASWSCLCLCQLACGSLSWGVARDGLECWPDIFVGGPRRGGQMIGSI